MSTSVPIPSSSNDSNNPVQENIKEGKNESEVVEKSNENIIVATTTSTSAAAIPKITCAICLEEFGSSEMVTLVCCNQQLCLEDAKKVGICPLCRQEPAVWFPGV